MLRDRLQPVLVGIDVVGGAEALVRDRAVVALEVVLAGDLPVGRELELVARRGRRARRAGRSSGSGPSVSASGGAPRPGSRTGTAPTSRGGAGRARGPPARSRARAPSAARPAATRRARRSTRGTGTAPTSRCRRPRRAATRGGGTRSGTRAARPRPGRRAPARRRPRPRTGRRPLDAPRMADVLPRAAEDPFLLAPQHVRVGVPAPGQGSSPSAANLLRQSPAARASSGSATAGARGSPGHRADRRRSRASASARSRSRGSRRSAPRPAGRRMFTTMYAPETRERSRCGTSAAKIDAALMSRIITPSPLPNSARKSIARIEPASARPRAARARAAPGRGCSRGCTSAPIPILRPSRVVITDPISPPTAPAPRTSPSVPALTPSERTA